MTEQHDSALPDDIVALLASAKAIAPLDASAKIAVLANVERQIALMHGPTHPAPGGTPKSPNPGEAGPHLAAGGAVVKLGTIASLAIVFALGAATGVAGDRAIIAAHHEQKPAAATSVLRAPSALAVSPSSLPTPEASTEGAAEPRVPTEPQDAPVPGPPTLPARGLGPELALLDAARTSLARGEANQALLAVKRHEKTYPAGALVEEREAIAVKALVALGRLDEARERARDLERRFPNGITLRSVKASLGESH